jgi:hypothetical protein
MGGLYGLFGLIYGVFFALFAGLGAIVGLASGQVGALLGLGFALLALIGAPILFGVMGLVAGAVFAFLYNVVASRLGGLQLQLDIDEGKRGSSRH